MKICLFVRNFCYLLQDVSVVSATLLFSCGNKKNSGEASLFPRTGREGKEVGDGRRRRGCLAAGGGCDHHYHHCDSLEEEEEEEKEEEEEEEETEKTISKK